MVTMEDARDLDPSVYTDKDMLLTDKHSDDTSYQTPRHVRKSRLRKCLETFSIFAVITATVLGFFTIQDFSHKTPQPPPRHCEHAMTRPSFHALLPHRRHALTVAVQRLMNTPSRLNLNASLYDDFTYVHIQLKNTIHHSAISLPWHRLFIHAFESALRKEGGYDGYLPYWDWTLDAEDPLSSPIWDSWAGFGGNGSAVDDCVEDGILGGYVARYDEWSYKEHCVKRKFEDSVQDGMMHGKQWSKDVVRDIVMGSETYEEFRERLEGGPHKHLHLGIGGEMFGIGSTNDPLFFVHHAQIDRLWWLWQQQDPEKRNHEYLETSQGSHIEDQLAMLGLGDNRTVNDVMTTTTDMLCYKYAKDL